MISFLLVAIGCYSTEQSTAVSSARGVVGGVAQEDSCATSYLSVRESAGFCCPCRSNLFIIAD